VVELRADALAAMLPRRAWKKISAGAGSKGPREYHWARAAIRPLEDTRSYWLLVRRSLADPTDLAYYLCHGPERTPLRELVRVAGARWAIEETFQTAKGQVGLDQYQVRRYDSWYRHITLAMLAHAFLTVTTADGLASNSIYELVEDGRGVLWISGPNGISEVSRRELDEVAELPGGRVTLTLYGISEGLESLQMCGGEKPAGLLTSRGEVWFPSSRGPVRISID